MNTRKDNNFLCTNQKKKKKDAEKSVRDSKILLFCQPYYHSSPYQKKELKYYNMKRKKPEDFD